MFSFQQKLTMHTLKEQSQFEETEKVSELDSDMTEML